MVIAPVQADARQNFNDRPIHTARTRRRNTCGLIKPFEFSSESRKSFVDFYFRCWLLFRIFLLHFAGAWFIAYQRTRASSPTTNFLIYLSARKIS